MRKEREVASKETDRKFNEMREDRIKEQKQTNYELKSLRKLFTTEWGTLMEALIKPSVRKLFSDWGIPTNRIMTNVEIKNDNNEDIAEFDIVLKNGDTIIVMEVKTRFDVKKVDYFLEKMNSFGNHMQVFAYIEYSEINIFRS